MGRKPSVLCAGGCGNLMWAGNGTLPAGQSTCRPCRRAAWGDFPPRGPAPRRLINCAKCGTEFESSYPAAKFCPDHRSRNDRRPPSRQSGRVWARIRAQVLTEESDCWVCGKQIDFEARAPDPWSPTVDHVVPVSRGGGDERSNLRAAHWTCNVRRGNQMRTAA
jgi:hypothetical protein